MTSLDTTTALGRLFAASRFAALGVLLLFGFTAVYSAAFHNPEPATLRVGVVGPPAALQAARAALDPREFLAVSYGSPAAVRRALARDEVHGAYAGGRILIA